MERSGRDRWRSGGLKKKRSGSFAIAPSKRCYYRECCQNLENAGKHG
ncbi:MAG: hypothetical protein AB4290_20195 [Spirulina sp.]